MHGKHPYLERVVATAYLSQLLSLHKALGRPDPSVTTYDELIADGVPLQHVLIPYALQVLHVQGLRYRM